MCLMAPTTTRCAPWSAPTRCGHVRCCQFWTPRLVLYKTYLKLDNEVKAAVRADPVCQRLMTVPGVGAITALTFRAAVDDPNRFKSSRTVAAHFGLTPRRFQSGETDNPGRISQVWRSGSAQCAVCGGACAGHPQQCVVFAEGMGHPPGQDTRSPPRRDRRGPETRRHPARCGSTAPSSDGVRRKSRHELDTPIPRTPPGASLAWTMVWMKPQMSDAPSSATKSQALHSVRPMHAASRATSEPTAERSVTHAETYPTNGRSSTLTLPPD